MVHNWYERIYEYYVPELRLSFNTKYYFINAETRYRVQENDNSNPVLIKEFEISEPMISWLVKIYEVMELKEQSKTYWENAQKHFFSPEILPATPPVDGPTDIRQTPQEVIPPLWKRLIGLISRKITGK